MSRDGDAAGTGVASGEWFTLRWSDEGVVLLDQRLLPGEETYLTLGSTAAMGVARAGLDSRADDLSGLEADLGKACERLARTRPTAVNLFWSLDRMRATFAEAAAEPGAGVDRVRERLVEEARCILREDVATCRAIGAAGVELVPEGACILTHCNAGALATGGYGTALGVVRAAAAVRSGICVLADETRPFLQGARLTAWELQREGIRVTVITDNMAGHFMSRGDVDLVVVGADRIAGNGDVANKIGTYTVAVLAREHGLPFYVAAPLSTVDLDTPDGAAIPIEERRRDEVADFGARPVVPAGVPVRNPAFDVTPARLVTAIVTERGVLRPPYTESLREAFRG